MDPDLYMLTEYCGPCDFASCGSPRPYYKIEDGEIRCLAHLDVPAYGWERGEFGWTD